MIYVAFRFFNKDIYLQPQFVTKLVCDISCILFFFFLCRFYKYQMLCLLIKSYLTVLDLSVHLNIVVISSIILPIISFIELCVLFARMKLSYG